FKSISGTRIICLPVPLCFRSSCESAPRVSRTSEAGHWYVVFADVIMPRTMNRTGALLAVLALAVALRAPTAATAGEFSIRRTMTRTGALLAVLTLAVALLASAAATAEEFSSQYTSADVKKCRKFDRVVVAGDEIAASWACPGVAGYLVVVSEDDLRT